MFIASQSLKCERDLVARSAHAASSDKPRS
jgi:hypothetical protein